MFGESGFKMLLGAIGIPPEAIDALPAAMAQVPAMAQQFQDLAAQFQRALVDMEERQKRIEAMVAELHGERFGSVHSTDPQRGEMCDDRPSEPVRNGTDTVSPLALTDSGANGRPIES